VGDMINGNDQDFSAYNLACLRQAAERMGPLREEVIFLGGTVLPLLVNGSTALKIRKSKDVDLLADFQSKNEIYAFEDELWERGFKKKSTGAVCRWVLDDIRIDILPADPDVVGFNNRWCREAMSAFLRVDLGRNLVIKIIGAPWFLAAKFNAFYRRGEGDYAGSYDIYDMLVLFAGRPELEREIAESAGMDLRVFLAQELDRVWQGTDALRVINLDAALKNGNGEQLPNVIRSRMRKIITDVMG